MVSGSASGTGKTERRRHGSTQRPAAPTSRAATHRTRRTASIGPILFLVSVLALLGLGGWLLIREGRLPNVAAELERPSDPARLYKVSEAIDRRQMRPVWTLLNMTGLEQVCRKARAFTVTREAEGAAAMPTRFVVYCGEQGFWLVEADASGERWGTLGPFATREQVEAMIDSEGEFLWGSRSPGKRNFVGGLAGER
jgi:hypothetical protein